MVCQHLAELERLLIAAGIPETYRGQPWSTNCREWVYFACWLDRESIRSRLTLADCVKDHDHHGTHSGQEAGLECIECHDGVMGVHPVDRANLPVFK